MKNLDTVLKEKEDLVENLQKEIEALKFVSVLLKEDATITSEPAVKAAVSSGLASVQTPTHVMQSSSSGASFEREPGGYLGASSGLKQFP
ncbi:MAG: hypothetical protein L0Z53_00560 [Acidobacteriales bacterium]|nr:hypothetical protein [Terriglobales bacterium]